MFPGNVKFLSTPRFIEGGASESSYANFNLAHHVGDEPISVSANRQLLRRRFDLPSEPKWLDQHHSSICVNVDKPHSQKADASISQIPGVVCAVLTADCLPVFLARKDGSAVGVVHAGWRGLLGGVLESSISALDEGNCQIVAHLGPAISQKAFEVGAEVREGFIDKCPAFNCAFIKHNNKYRFDLYAAARTILTDHNIQSISGGDRCTFSEQHKYYSFRRDGEQSGRMAHLIWMV